MMLSSGKQIFHLSLGMILASILYISTLKPYIICNFEFLLFVACYTFLFLHGIPCNGVSIDSVTETVVSFISWRWQIICVSKILGIIYIEINNVYNLQECQIQFNVLMEEYMFHEKDGKRWLAKTSVSFVAILYPCFDPRGISNAINILWCPLCQTIMGFLLQAYICFHPLPRWWLPWPDIATAHTKTNSSSLAWAMWMLFKKKQMKYTGLLTGCRKNNFKSGRIFEANCAGKNGNCAIMFLKGKIGFLRNA